MASARAWCSVCCTQHTYGRGCPGNLLATGPERHARKFAVTTDNRLEYYGILIAEAGEVWRARVFTYPNMLWSVPGRRGTMKFAGATATEAEARAVEYLEEYCAEKRSTMQEADPDSFPGSVRQESSDTLSPQGGREERHPSKVPIRFGEERATQAATTANLSAGGIYIATDKPIVQGRQVRLLLDVQAYTIPLVGTVAWVRMRDEPGKPKGMGVQVVHPPALYLRYVEEIQERIANIAAGAAKPEPAGTG